MGQRLSLFVVGVPETREKKGARPAALLSFFFFRPPQYHHRRSYGCYQSHNPPPPVAMAAEPTKLKQEAPSYFVVSFYRLGLVCRSSSRFLVPDAFDIRSPSHPPRNFVFRCGDGSSRTSNPNNATHVPLKKHRHTVDTFNCSSADLLQLSMQVRYLTLSSCINSPSDGAS